MKFSALLVHYGEIAIKGRNRELFEKRLVRNIRIALGDGAAYEIQRLRGRLVIYTKGDADASVLVPRVQRVFGITNVAPAVRTDPQIDDIESVVLDIARNKQFESFAIRARRSEKGFHLTSQDVNTRVGASVQQATGKKVDLTSPQFTIGIEILKRHVFISSHRASCSGGLPVGMSGKIACLISGGIDSPVAVWRMMKRGCIPLFVHFHSAPYTSAASQDKVEEIACHLMQGQPATMLVKVPFGPVQQKIVVTIPAKYRVVLYRRFMLRIACSIANLYDASAIATGEALSQVASQTLSNLSTIDAVSTLPVLRPLIGCDKQEIVDQARAIGTYEMSIQPHDDCCSFLMPRNPITRSTVRELERVERALDVESLMQMSLEGRQERRIGVGGI